MSTPRRKRSQAGFSMVEMLMAAFIMGIGLLGLAMLQTMALRTNVGSRAQSTAILLAEGLLDDIQTNGRAAKLWTRMGSTPPGDLMTFFGGAGSTNLQYNYAGRRLPDADDPTPFYTVVVDRVAAVAPAAQIGGLADFTVTVSWTEGTGPSGAALTRNVVLTRRIGYAIN